ncbi:hypothetical protein SAMN05661010_02563 [Modicisalibacter muralis]|uniref:Uncharacterized protein n=1 Tax=Modicisalibacter muralis TaxID=119000 RepID=A0A1G9MY34_9GAMM|nr:hypothetical protein [Halomonas muralis]SDL79043.1 hypothetical protein SAMN05661010_02563 [Halomonas muralis]
MSLRAYSIYDRDAGPEEGAALAFAHSVKDARKIGFSTLRDWFGTEWIDVAADHLPCDVEWLAEQEGVDLNGETRLIESPMVCERCELWGRSPLVEKGICEECRDEDSEE